jgi:hypothetical protein
MDDRNRFNPDWILVITIVGALFFYLPFVSHNFMGDDWLWLSNAKKGLSNPSIFFQRPMYGYWRPLNMIIIALLYKIVGLNSYIFGLGNILLHAANIFLLSEVLKKFHADNRIRHLGAFIFAFYYLNAPVISWIATGHDIWVTFLSLLFILQIIKVFQKPNLLGFLLAWGLAFSAILFKESGFVTLGLYFLIAIFLKRSPFFGKFKYYTAFFIITFVAYLIYYGLTRTYADKQLVFGIDTLVNLWYFIAYMFLPLSKRIADTLPSSLVLFLKLIRIFIVISIPILFFTIIRKGIVAAKVFLFWSIMYISTIAIMKWGMGLFSLYPTETAGRFFYTADIGLAVVLAWLIIYFYSKTTISFLSSRTLKIMCAGVFVILNLAIVYKTNRIYATRQAIVGNLINDLRSRPDSLVDGDTLIVVLEGKNNPPQTIVESEQHMEAIIFMNLDKRIKVWAVNKNDYADAKVPNGRSKKVISWDARNKHLVIPVAE